MITFDFTIPAHLFPDQPPPPPPPPGPWLPLPLHTVAGIVQDQRHAATIGVPVVDGVGRTVQTLRAVIKVNRISTTIKENQ